MRENPLPKSQAIFASSHAFDQGLSQQAPLLLPLFKTDWEMRNSLEPTTLEVYLFGQEIVQDSLCSLNLFLNGRERGMERTHMTRS